jgi:hypothetical protein
VAVRSKTINIVIDERGGGRRDAGSVLRAAVRLLTVLT